MVTNLGSTVTGTTYNSVGHLGLPKPDTGVRPTHRPWCTDCKRHHEPDQLNTDGRCGKCAKAAVMRAAAAERRAVEEKARIEAAEREKATRRAQNTSPAPDDSPLPVRGDGATAPEIAREHGHSTSTIRKVLDRNNIPRRDDRARNTNQHSLYQPDPETLTEIKRLYIDEELSTVELAARFGHHRRVIARILQDAGVQIRPAAHLRASHLDPDDIVNRYQAGTSIVDIARTYHAKTARIRKVLTDAGVPIRPKGGSTHIATRLRDLGVTAKTVKQWAYDQGLTDEYRPTGLVSGALLDAYEKHHPTTKENIA